MKKYVLFYASFLSVFFAASLSYSNVLRYGVQSDSVRLVFDWLDIVDYTSTIEGNVLTVNFSRPFSGEVQHILPGLSSMLKGVAVSPDFMQIVFTFHGDVTDKNFSLGASIVFNVFKKGQWSSVVSQRPQAQAPPAPPVVQPVVRAKPRDEWKFRTGRHKNYFRLVLDPTVSASYKVDRNNGSLSVQLGFVGELDEKTLKDQLPALIQDVKITKSSNEMNVSFPLPGDWGYKHSKSGNKIILDFIYPSSPVAATTAVAAPKPDAVVEPPQDVTEESSEESSEVASVSPEQTKNREENNISAPRSNEISATANGTPGEENSRDIMSNRDVEGINMGRLISNYDQYPELFFVGRIIHDRDAMELELRFQFDKKVAAAIFYRNGYLWIAFNEARNLSLDDLVEKSQGFIQEAQYIPAERGTLVRMRLLEIVNIDVQKDENDWILKFMEAPLQRGAIVDVIEKSDDGSSFYIQLQAEEIAERIGFIDPNLGDRFYTIPIYTPGVGVYPFHSYPEVSLPETYQGIVVIPYANELSVDTTDTLVTLNTPGGIHTSVYTKGGKPSWEYDKVVIAGNEGSILGLVPFKPEGLESYVQDQQKLFGNLVLGSDIEKARQRFHLARFYISHGMGAEALGVLNTLGLKIPSLEKDISFIALKGVANYLLGRYQDAISDLGQPKILEYQDAALWFGAAQSELGVPDVSLEALESITKVTADYGNALKKRLYQSALAGAAQKKNEALLAGILESVAKDFGEDPKVNSMVTYYTGVLYWLRKDVPMATELFTELAKLGSPYYRARAIRDRGEMRHAEGIIDAVALIGELDVARYAWNNDPFEFEILMRLGELYDKVSGYREALRSYKTVVGYADDPEQVAYAERRMREVFQSLYLDGKSASMAPLKSIALFDEFRELVPSGSRGDSMIRSLVDHLASMDLLDESTQLLERQVKFRLPGIERSKIGTRLAIIHLLNQKPQEAVKVLLATQSPESLPVYLLNQRTYLMVRALMDLDREQEALELLQEDNTEDAALLKAEIHWQNGDWPKASEALALLVPPPAVVLRRPLSPIEARRILDLAVALTLDNNLEILSRLKQNYMDGMSVTEYREPFNLLTSVQEGEVMNFFKIREEIDKVKSFQGFLDRYKTRVRSGGLSTL